MKTIVSMVLLLVVLGGSIGAQTLTELLQKGIYTEETLSNREEAERIYRQILAAPAVPQAISEEAQRRLARLLLTSRPPRVEHATTVFPDARLLGAVEQGGRYRHFASGITFDVPPGWSAGQTFPSSDNGDMVALIDQTTGRSINVWMIKEEVPAAHVAEQVAGGPAEKVRQRHSGYGIPGMADSMTYDIPADTVRPVLINGRHAIVAVGTYQGVPMNRVTYGEPRQALQPMKEYMTWINTEHSRAFFFARVPDADLPQLRPVFEQLVNSAAFQ